MSQSNSGFLVICWALPLLCFLATAKSYARVATAPNFLDQRLINPAASSMRSVFGSTFEIRRQTEDANVLNLVDSSIDIKTSIDSFESNSAFRTGKVTWELNFVPQTGTKTTNSTQNSGTNSNNTSKLTLIPVQISAAGYVAKNFSVGLKLLTTTFDFDDNTDLTIQGADSSQESVNATKKFKGNIIVYGPGVIYELGQTGITFSYVAEFFQFKNELNIQETNTKSNNDTKTSLTTNVQSTDSLSIRKDVIGMGYSRKFSGGNNFRIDLSFEKMPPLTKSAGYPSGELYRLNTETNFSYVRVGVEITNRTGYYVDPYNLIPYFFKVDHLGISAVQEISFFGGLRTSKGHGFGASISQSSSTEKEQLSAGSSVQDIEKKNFKFGLSYTYVF